MNKRVLITSVFFSAVILLQTAGCDRQEKIPVGFTDEENPPVATALNVADPRASLQLLRGFYDVEQNAWRWTKQAFSVTLRTPPDAQQKGGTLQVGLIVPETVIQQLKSVTLRASVAGQPLPAETYSEAGEHSYVEDVPSAALAEELVIVDFTLDKIMTPGPSDQRELGIVVSTVGLLPK